MSEFALSPDSATRRWSFSLSDHDALGMSSSPVVGISSARLLTIVLTSEVLWLYSIRIWGLGSCKYIWAISCEKPTWHENSKNIFTAFRCKYGILTLEKHCSKKNIFGIFHVRFFLREMAYITLCRISSITGHFSCVFRQAAIPTVPTSRATEKKRKKEKKKRKEKREREKRKKENEIPTKGHYQKVTQISRSPILG